MNALERITAVLERARIDGGWTDEVVAHRVLIALGLDEDGRTAASRDNPLGQELPTSSNLEHG